LEEINDPSLKEEKKEENGLHISHLKVVVRILIENVKFGDVLPTAVAGKAVGQPEWFLP
jgi:hypothetical protein